MWPEQIAHKYGGSKKFSVNEYILQPTSLWSEEAKRGLISTTREWVQRDALWEAEMISESLR